MSNRQDRMIKQLKAQVKGLERQLTEALDSTGSVRAMRQAELEEAVLAARAAAADARDFEAKTQAALVERDALRARVAELERLNAEPAMALAEVERRLAEARKERSALNLALERTKTLSTALAQDLAESESEKGALQAAYKDELELLRARVADLTAQLNAADLKKLRRRLERRGQEVFELRQNLLVAQTELRGATRALAAYRERWPSLVVSPKSINGEAAP